MIVLVSYVRVEADFSWYVRVLKDLNMSLLVQVPEDNLAVEAACQQLVGLLLIATPSYVQYVVLMLPILSERHAIENLVYL